MILFPFVRRSAFSALESFCDTEIWRLERENKTLKEREAARAACMATLEERRSFLENEREQLLRDLHDAMAKKSELESENRELRCRLDTVRAELSRTRHREKTLELMNGALEARVGAGGEE